MDYFIKKNTNIKRMETRVTVSTNDFYMSY